MPMCVPLAYIRVILPACRNYILIADYFAVCVMEPLHKALLHFHIFMAWEEGGGEGG